LRERAGVRGKVGCGLAVEEDIMVREESQLRISMERPVAA
jgi:hypothetical protein